MVCMIAILLFYHESSPASHAKIYCLGALVGGGKDRRGGRGGRGVAREGGGEIGVG